MTAWRFEGANNPNRKNAGRSGGIPGYLAGAGAGAAIFAVSTARRITPFSCLQA